MFDSFKRATNAIVSLVNRAEANNNRAVATLVPQGVIFHFLSVVNHCANRNFVLRSLSEASVLLSKSRFLTLARNVSFADAEKSDIIIFDLKSKNIINHVNCPQNLDLHRLVYTHSSFEAVLLCHPKYAMHHFVENKALDFSLLPILESKIGPVAICDVQDLVDFVSDHTVIFVRNIGILSLGETLDQSYERIELLEWICWQNQNNK